ncbi:sensor histidine kinase [Ornithinimicrobium tianjinense]|uniref:Signal transduction histidine kinase n=1 Tax=Ornithinimicrobium tianjinense TaxID=1195761 RepID=A0A917BY95_9MICO|nr:histidine kinase [Ornithinimicrobium tianjinense]GGF60170.1 signal transduction histidine kinase [Ornithinimicrobium tianjinense]
MPVQDALHLPTAIVVLAVVLVGHAVYWLLRRRVRRGFLSETDRLTYETLRLGSQAGRQLRTGLTSDTASRAARNLRLMLAARAVALTDTQALLGWAGRADHHADQVLGHARRVLEGGDVVVLTRADLPCANPDCEIRAGVVAPLVVDDRVTGALAAYSDRPSAGLARATEELATWVGGQLELGELDRERTRAMEAELRSLRAQISPHFVYNSLTAIASFVRTDPDRARELLLEFADFTRYALRRGGAFTPLADELRNVERYLVLEQARFGERLRVNLLIAPEVLPVVVPYLVVQPLVENAVRHGLAGKEGVGTVSITATDLGDLAEIVVEDDGVGTDPERIRRALDGGTEGGPADSLGLGNVDARLRQVYGDDHGLVVETAPGLGTRASFRVPKFAPGVRA